MHISGSGPARCQCQCTGHRGPQRCWTSSHGVKRGVQNQSCFSSRFHFCSGFNRLHVQQEISRLMESDWGSCKKEACQNSIHLNETSASGCDQPKRPALSRLSSGSAFVFSILLLWRLVRLPPPLRASAVGGPARVALCASAARSPPQLQNQRLAR